MLRVIVLILFGIIPTVSAYGPIGHEIVGGIADKLIAGTPTAEKVKALLNGITLEKAAVMPDEIKAWDKNGPDDPRAFPHYVNHPQIDRQMREFWYANQPTHDPNALNPSHHWFHYTDVPVTAKSYASGIRGRNKWDVVHMIPFCIGVLQGEIPESNPRKITKPVAVILLAHYVGDIHQPLHVGAEYFDPFGRVVADPDKSKSVLEDEGGNTLSLHLRGGDPEGTGKRGLKLHGFWDGEAVNVNLDGVLPGGSKEERRVESDDAKRKLIDEFTAKEPPNWRLPSSVPLKKYAEAWADEILPLAREAHERLDFNGVHSQMDHDQEVAAGGADEKDAPDHLLYTEWAGKVVRLELHKAGWRLADLLTQALSSATLTSSAAPAASQTPQTSATPVSTPPPVAPTATVTPSIPNASADSGYGQYPQNYKEIISTWMTTNSLNGSQIDWQGAPMPAELPGRNGQKLRGYLVIFNTHEGAKSKTRSVLIRDGVVVGNLGF